MKSLLDVKSFRLFNSKGEFVVEFLVRFVRWKVNAIETRRKKSKKYKTRSKIIL